MNGRRAKAQRRAAATIPRDATVAIGGSDGSGSHPLGPWVGAVLETRRRRDAAMEIIRESNLKALLACTGDTDCNQSVHTPHCLAVR